MNEQEKIIETIEENANCVEIEVEKESKFKDFMSKAKTVIKKHGKTVAAVATVGAAALIGCAFGKKSNECGFIDTADIDDNCCMKSIEEELYVEDEPINEE